MSEQALISYLVEIISSSSAATVRDYFKKQHQHIRQHVLLSAQIGAQLEESPIFRSHQAPALFRSK